MADSKTNVLVLYTAGFQFTDRQIQTLRDEYPTCDITAVDENDATAGQLERAEVMVGFVRPEHIRAAKNLKWLQLSSIGVDKHVDRALYANPDFRLTNSSGAYGKPISDYVVCAMIMLAKSMHILRDQQQSHLWRKIDARKDLFESTVAVLGLGDVGGQVAYKAKALGMRVLAVKRRPSPKPDYVDELFLTEEADKVIPQADFVVLTMAATPDTKGFMDRRRLALMRKDAYLINIGRGTLVDQEALAEALNSEAIAGAALDVTTPEPLPQDSPLWDAKNLILTPHISGKSPSTYMRHFALFEENLGRYLEGQPLKNLIDFDRQY